MKIEINIQKKHFIIILISLFLITGLIFAVAQPSTPNPGHSINEVPAATPNCLTNPTHPFCQAASAQSWGLGDVAIASGYSAYSINSGNANTANSANTANNANNAGNSNNLGGTPASSYCQVSGTNCKVMNQANCQDINIQGSGFWTTCPADRYMAGIQPNGPFARIRCCKYT
ncbi:hypothetical protein FJZ21_01480 [Candidatus Pacearchaeota archaeon]|nr:hypothetical protein [Candidatus Pacearchaeota archaeon]